MNNYLFKEFQNKKQKLIELANKANEFGWIDDNRKNEIINKINNDTLTIGVIGQMKCGKSTFLNSFVFENTILPADVTPMTATLSVITYGENERIVADFYTLDEWEEQKMQAARSMDEACGNVLEESKIRAAKELVEKSTRLGDSIHSLLGTTKDDSLSNLIDYVGANGKYVSITKSVTIYYPKDYLKGVEIVDTPGFNDPIVSREERTKGFLKNADVVLLLVYAGRAFDATDREIVFKNISQCGIGKVLIGINKYDLPFCDKKNPMDEEQIKTYVKNEIVKACSESSDDTLKCILDEVEPIPLSAEMALLSDLPMSIITSSEGLKHAWDRHCKGFGISTQNEMYEHSHVEELTNAIKTIIETEKDKILFTKPLNAIAAAGAKEKVDIELNIAKCNENIKILSMPDAVIDEQEEILTKVNRKINKKIDSLGEELDYEIQNIVRKGKNELEDTVDASCKRMVNIVHNDWGVFKTYKTVKPKLEAELNHLTKRELTRATEQIATDAKKQIDKCIDEFFDDTEDIFMKHLPDFDSRSFIKAVRRKVQLETDGSINEEFDMNQGNGVGRAIINAVASVGFGLIGVGFIKIIDALTHNHKVAKVEECINEIYKNFNPEPYLKNIFKCKDRVIETAKQSFIKELVEPLQQQLDEIRKNKNSKEENLRIAKEKLAVLTSKKDDIAKQMSEFEQLKNVISGNN